MGYGVPGHGNEAGLEIVFDLERLDQTGIGPLSDAVVRPEEDIRAFAALGGSLEFLGDLFLGFNFNRDTNFFFKGFTEVT